VRSGGRERRMPVLVMYGEGEEEAVTGGMFWRCWSSEFGVGESVFKDVAATAYPLLWNCGRWLLHSMQTRGCLDDPIVFHISFPYLDQLDFLA